MGAVDPPGRGGDGSVGQSVSFFAASDALSTAKSAAADVVDTATDAAKKLTD